MKHTSRHITKPIAAVAAGLALGFIVANPEPVIELAMLFMPLAILLVYFVVVIKIKRGLSAQELAVALGLIASGVGYHAANRQFAKSLSFAITASLPIIISVIVHAMLNKHRNSSVLVKWRGTKLYRIMQTDLKI